VIYQHPLAYLVGVEGLALLRAWAGDFDEAFVRERLDEVRRLLDEPALRDHPGVRVRSGDLPAAYAGWAATYDDEDNGLFGLDGPIVEEILGALPAGTALDAACGTGRYARFLAGRGHRVVGVDGSAPMLARAREQVPAGVFARGDLHRLPVADGSVDVVVCALALTHVRDLAPVLAEFARVLRPGGSVVVSDVHHELVTLGSVVRSPGPHGEPGLAPTYRHRTGDHLRAALAAGLRVVRCEEPVRTPRGGAGPPPEHYEPGEWEDWPWTLLPLVPAAFRAAWAKPDVVVWHFRLDG
jgi:SAM-dependent methyltransferase